VADVPFVWWERWRAFGPARASAEAHHQRDAYAPREDNGQPNWAKWAKDNPAANKLINWAYTDDDTD
jgi:hypothetical protein